MSSVQCRVESNIYSVITQLILITAFCSLRLKSACCLLQTCTVFIILHHLIVNVDTVLWLCTGKCGRALRIWIKMRQCHNLCIVCQWLVLSSQSTLKLCNNTEMSCFPNSGFFHRYFHFHISVSLCVWVYKSYYAWHSWGRWNMVFLGLLQYPCVIQRVFASCLPCIHTNNVSEQW